MSLCGKPMPKAKSGAARGKCTRSPQHTGRHGNNSCVGCAAPSEFGVYCSNCNAKRHKEYVIDGGKDYFDRRRDLTRKRLGQHPRNTQKAGKIHTFPCGCSGVLPPRGKSNNFAYGIGHSFSCRVSRILNGSRQIAKRDGYKPIPDTTPHLIIRKMMEEPDCALCGESMALAWAIPLGCRAPHLHHNHETGEPLGFTHPVCNPRAMENEIDRLKTLLKKNGISNA